MLLVFAGQGGLAVVDRAAEKRRIRGIMRERRRSLGEAEQARHAQGLCDVVRQQAWYQESDALGCYWAMDGEISLGPLILLSWELNKRVFLPVIGATGDMRFLEYRPGDSLRDNHFGIAEPLATAAEAGLPELDTVFVPVVAFTADGGRLGMGGGYYDRLFSPPASADREQQGPLLVGVAHGIQRQATLPADDWDVSMQWVVTESGVVRSS